jgi:hypothetical protein
MKKMLSVCLLLLAGYFCSGQEKNLVQSILLKPKNGMAPQFEAALKAHNMKFHAAPAKAYVFQFISGDKMGYYQVAFPPGSWADMDNMKPNPAHEQDVQNSIATKLDVNEGWIFSRKIDSLSHGDQNWDIAKSRMTYWHMKRGKMQEFAGWLRKIKLMLDDTKDPRNVTIYSKSLAGTDGQFILVTRYKEGWKEMEPNFYTPIKDMFIKTYSSAEWDNYMKVFDDCVVKEETYLRVFRPDLSTK